MSRYIDADKLIERLVFKRNTDNIDRKKYAGLECAIAQCKKAPTADVVEVRHGEWETILDCQPNRLLAYRHICSECKNTYKDLNCRGHNYCHWCGAKMDGERREENER